MSASIYISEPGWYRITGSLENPVATKLPGPQVGDRVEPGQPVGQPGSTHCPVCNGPCKYQRVSPDVPLR